MTTQEKLEKLAAQGLYLFPRSRPPLMWSSASNDARGVSDDWFPFVPFAPFYHPIGEHTGRVARFLIRAPQPASNSGELFQLYRDVTRTLDIKNKKVSPTQLSRLIVVRDALRDRLGEAAEVARVNLQVIKSILKVWVFETAEDKQAPIIVGYLSSDEHMDVLLDVSYPLGQQAIYSSPLHTDAARLWRALVTGAPGAQIRVLAETMFRRYSKDPELTMAQQDGLFSYLPKRDANLNSAVLLGLRVTVYERVIDAALEGKTIPSWGKVNPHPGEGDGRVKFTEEDQDWLRETFREVRRDHPGWSQNKVYHEVAGKFEDVHGKKPPSKRTMLRYVKD